MTDKTFLEQVNEKILENKTEMLASLSELLSIPSVAVETDETDERNGAGGGMPFGQGVDRVYRRMLELGAAAGFDTFDADGYGGHIDYDGTEDGVIGIIGHLDVVPAGDGWDFDPYGGQIEDGYVLGRGASDDKGPVVASFYAMKALKECGFEPAKTVRLILGLDEETNWKGMTYYLERTPDLPDAGFTPDADFPVIRAEKGILVFDIVAKLPKSRGKGLELSSLTGGTAANAVPDFARAVVSDSSGGKYDLIRETVADCAAACGWDISCKGVGRSLEISVRGKSAHGAHPDLGTNAISILMEFLGRLTFLNDGVTDFVDFYNKRIGFDLHGERIGCPLEDEASGKLVFNVGKAEIDKGSARLTINIRYPVSAGGEEVYAGIMQVLDVHGYGIVKDLERLPIDVDPDSDLVRTLMDVYRRHTGDVASEPLVIGGGTYARAMENIVAFGARFPGEPGLEHQKNEKISVDNMVRLAQIYAEAVYELAKAED